MNIVRIRALTIVMRRQIRMIDLTWMHDLPQASLDFNANYYGLSDPLFLEFLWALRLRTYPGAGTDKQAFRALKEKAHLRGWGSARFQYP